ncbi:MAG: DUF2142 domain-containing protein, partial [Spirochaetaceae bacterium]|nr:DUF2142 domain-containing protein [Spirochaetaceae bacterium]
NQEKNFSWQSMVLLCFAAFFIAPAKTLYFPIIALFFTINFKSIKLEKKSFLLPTFIILAAVFGIISNQLIAKTFAVVYNPVTGIGSTLPSLESVNNYDSLKYLSKTSVLWIVSHPFQYIYILLNSCRERLSYWIMTLGGRYLGWEAIPMNELLIYSMCGMIVWQLVRKTDGIKTTLKNRIISIAIFVTIFLLILTGQFMMGIDPISPVIVGVQGRYLIPIVPLIFLFRKDISTSCEDTELSIHFAQIGILLFLSIDLFFRIIGIY